MCRKEVCYRPFQNTTLRTVDRAKRGGNRWGEGQSYDKLTTPKNESKLRGLLGLKGYYGRFVKKNEDMATPTFSQSTDFTQYRSTFVSKTDPSGFKLDVLLAQSKMKKQIDSH